MFCFKIIALAFRLLNRIIKDIQFYYHKVENVVINDEKNDNIKLKKKMLLYYMFNLMAYFFLLFLTNPHAPKVRCILYSFFTMIQVILLRTKTYKYLAWSFVILNFIYVNLATFNKDESLKVVLIALMLHNVVFLLPEIALLRLFYFGISLIAVQRAQKQLFIYLEEGNLFKLEVMLTDFYYTWPLMFMVNHSGAMYLVGAYQRVNRDNKEIQDKLTEANKQLLAANEKLSSTLAELEKRNNELKGALQARELFIASVSHELRNPLNAMIGNIELLILDVGEYKWLEMLETCKVCGEVLLGMINNVLDVAKINAEKLELHYLPENFHKFAEKAWKVSTMKIQQKGLQGEMKISRNLPKYLKIDSHRLMQIMLNLIGNSAKFTVQGSVNVLITWHENKSLEDLSEPCREYMKLMADSRHSEASLLINTHDSDSGDELIEEIKTPLGSSHSSQVAHEGSTSLLNKSSLLLVRQPKFFEDIACSKFLSMSLEETKIRIPSFTRLNNQRREGIIRIDIIDTGVGIPSKALKQLFQPFTQADASITRRFGGTGLGLYITEQLIQKMGGKISVYSQENVGSNFSVLIPAQTVASSEVRDKLHEEIHNPNEKQSRALVVDDLPSNQIIISSYLKRLNIQSDVASNGQEAVELLKIKGFCYYTFITMDLQMPVMDGLTAMKEIRKHEEESGIKRNHSIPIIVITGNCTNQEKTECLKPEGEIRADYFHRKPFRYDECKNVVQSILAKQRLNLASPSKRKRILIADDDPFNQRVIQDYLQRYGFKCDTVGNGIKVLQKLAKGEKYDAILMDCEMPHMDGYTTAKHIQGKYDILIIGITGNTDGYHLEKALKSGMKYVETKPIDFKKLINLLLNH